MILKQSPAPSYRPAPKGGGVKFVLGKPHNGTPCQCCGREIKPGRVYCWLCAIFGGQRRVR